MDYSNFIGIYGGAFNPMTNAHLLIAQTIIDKFNLPKIIFVPEGEKYHLRSDLLPSKMRLEAIKRVIADKPKFEVSDIEIRSETELRTVETLQLLKAIYPNNELAFIIGSDNLENFDTVWYQYDKLLDNYYFIVVSRNSRKPDDIISSNPALVKYKDKFIILNYELSSLSATKVRELNAEGKSVKDLIPIEAYEYLKEIGWIKEGRE